MGFNEVEGRFMRIKRFSIEQVESLHNVEREADLLWTEKYRDSPSEAGEGWLVEGNRFMDKIDRGLGAFWDANKLEADRAREIELFQADKIVRRAFAKLDAAERYLPELHVQDFEVLRKSYCPNLSKGSSANRDKVNEIYSRAAKPAVPYAD